MNLNLPVLRERLNDFDFAGAFGELNWSRPRNARPLPLELEGKGYAARAVAELGAVVYEVTADDGGVPDAEARERLAARLAEVRAENVAIFVDKERSQSVWVWLKREAGEAGHRARTRPRSHVFLKGQPDDLIVSKLAGLFVDIAEFGEDGSVEITRVADKLRAALDTRVATKEFYRGYQKVREDFARAISGIESERDRAWYASVLLHRLMFVYFLQVKGFLNADQEQRRYLQVKLAQSKKRGPDRFYSEFLRALFFEGFARPPEVRSPEASALLGEIKYLNGGLFLPHRIEDENPSIAIPDRAFEGVLDLLGGWDWSLDARARGNAKEINPDVLGHIFEKYINQKAFGAYYTPEEITTYLCEQTIQKLVLERVNAHRRDMGQRTFATLDEALLRLDLSLCRELLTEILPRLALLDPACGSGAFLVSALKTLLAIYSPVYGRAGTHFSGDPAIGRWLREAGRHPRLDYYLKKRIITENLYGVDLMGEAGEIARLRLFLALVSSAETVDELEPLPNIDFNILSGNSLVGLLHVDEAEYEKSKPLLELHGKSYRQLVVEKNAALASYRNAAEVGIEDLRGVRDDIETMRREAKTILDKMLLEEFGRLGVRFEEATWDAAKGKEGKPKKRALTLEDIQRLEPFHWGYEFSEVMESRPGRPGGFDAIIANPPWDVFESNQKEFFQTYEPEIRKKALGLEDWQKRFTEFMADPEIRETWLEYASTFPFASKYFKSTPQFAHSQPTINGRRVAAKINLYVYFLEQSLNLLRPGGECGIVIPSGVYTDQGAKGLREVLFSSAKITGLFGFENRRMIFEGVDSRFKFVVLTFEKGGSTSSFPAAFMRLDPAELEAFPQEGGLELSVDLVRRVSPDTLSVPELHTATDLHVIEKVAAFPALGETLPTWGVSLTQELNMSGDYGLFEPAAEPGRVPLVQGGMFHQFDASFAPPKHWVDLEEGRAEVLGRERDAGHKLAYQDYRFAHRRIARNTDTRTLIAAVLPPNRFCADTAQTVRNILPRDVTLYLTAVMNSFVVDYLIRQRVTAHCDMHFVYALRIPRLTAADPRFSPIVSRAARLVCTTPEFDELARAVGMAGHEEGAREPGERARLRAELDGLVAHLYGLSEEEFEHVLGTFPLVAGEVKAAALEQYRAMAPKSGDREIAALIAAGEGARLEFKSSLRWDVQRGNVNKALEGEIVKTVAAFLNGDGGTLLIGVADDGTVLGIERDLTTVQKRNADGFELHLRNNVVFQAVGLEFAPYVAVSFHEVEGRAVCRVTVRPAPREVWAKVDGQEQFYVRNGNLSPALGGRAALEYIRLRWK